MTWDFPPFVGYGPLLFGMRQQEALELLGQPEKVETLHAQMAHLIVPAVICAATIDLLRRSTLVSFADSASNNRRPALTFVDDQLRKIHLQDRRDSLVLRGVDIWDKNRAAVITGLARGEKVMLFSGGDYYFESLGRRITAPKFWKTNGSIGLYSREGLEEECASTQPYEYDPEEITGKEC